MQNKDAKQGYPVYILDRKNITLKQGKVTNSPLPHFDNHLPGTTKMVVDLNVECEGKTTSYVLDDCSELGYVGDIIITLNRECVIRELESIKARSEEALRMVDWHNSAVEKCDQLLKDFSTEYKDRAESAERMNCIEGKVDKLADALASLLTKLDNKGGIR